MLTTEIQKKNDEIHVIIEDDFEARVTEWFPARHDLGLNGPGDSSHEDFRVVNDDDERIVLAFPDAEAIERVQDELYEKAEGRFKAGMTSEAEDVQTFAGALPSEYEVDNA